jgi:site-specific DNA-methyltransferase (adenine-specific)
VAHNVLTHGVGAINIDACRVGTDIGGWGGCAAGGNTWDETNMGLGKSGAPRPVVGRFPANVIHDGSDEVFDAFAAYGEGHARGNNGASKGGGGMYGHGATLNNFGAGDSGTPARFFYSAKASAKDRAGSKHPTVKPISLIKYLATLVTPPGGLCLDPFAGSGTLGAAWPRSILIERDAEYHQDILRRLSNMGEFTAPCDEAVGQGDGGAQADLFGNAPPSAHREEKFTECSPMKNSNATGKP